MKNNGIKKMFNILFAFSLLSLLTACGGKTESVESSSVIDSNQKETINVETESEVDPNQKIIDYADAESFELALNQGEDLSGKIVQFTVLEYHPDSAAGKDIWAGEHLNFVSVDDPGFDAGDTMTVMTTKIVNELGSWFIGYEIVDDAVIGSKTISKNSIPEKESLEIVDSGWYLQKSDSEDSYIYYCALVKNPNEKYITEFPTLTATAKNSEGVILGSDEHVGSSIAPGDTVVLGNMLAVASTSITDDLEVSFSVECDEYNPNLSSDGACTSDFEITNVSEQKGSNIKVTGEIKNNFDEDVDMVNIAAVFRKDGKIVFMHDELINNLAAGQTKPFEIAPFINVPDYDEVEVIAMNW